MPETYQIIEQLDSIMDALEEIPFRCAEIKSAEDFTNSQKGKAYLDSICMILIGVGEALKKTDRMTGGKLLSQYPDIDWSAIKGVRDVMAHGYFDIDAEEVFSICRNDIQPLTITIRRMIEDIQNGLSL